MQVPRSDLPDETGDQDALIQLKFALDAEAEWRRRLESLADPDALLSLLRAAARSVPYFRERLRGVPEHALTLGSFPIVRRGAYNEHPEQFLMPEPQASDPRFVASTNGTLGPQLAVRLDAAGWYELHYGTYVDVAAALPGLVDRLRPGAEGVFLINNNPHQPRASAYLPTLNLALLRQLVLGRSDHEDAAILAHLRSVPVPLLYGKASSLVALASADAASAGAGGGIRPFAILVSGEGLYEDQRARLEAWFRCPLLDAYISTEGGMIALECRHRTGLHVREDRVHVEVLTRQGAICEVGAGELLLTNLVSRGHVFIRYALGDEVDLARGTCPCGFEGKTITALHGRESPHVVLPGGPVPSRTFEQFLLGLPLEEFQVFQAGDAAPWLKWVPATEDAERVAAIAQAIHAWLEERGWQAQIASIPLGRITPLGGKHRRCVRVEG